MVTDFVGVPVDHKFRDRGLNTTRKHSFAYTLDSEFNVLEGGDTNLPSQEEIQPMTRRLFGLSSLPKLLGLAHPTRRFRTAYCIVYF